MWIFQHTRGIALIGLLMAGFATGAAAQSASGGNGLLAAGTKALTSKNYQLAVKQLTQALNAGKISDQNVAIILARRGEANLKLSRPAQAISDISSALWLKSLPKLELARAHQNRATAFQAVGMADRASADLSQSKRLDPDGKLASALTRARQRAAQAPAAQAPPTPVAERRVAAPRQTQTPSGVRPAAGPPEPRPAVAASPFRTTIVPGQQSDGRPALVTTVMPEARTPKPAAPPVVRPQVPTKPEKPGRFSRFFNSIWGSEPENRKKTPGGDQGPPLASGRRTPAAEATPTTPAAGTSASEGYRIQLAAVRTEAEAQATWQRLASRHKSLLDGREHSIRKTELGTLGTFYRIQIGPFSDKKQSLRVCNSFKRSGVECFLVAN